MQKGIAFFVLLLSLTTMACSLTDGSAFNDGVPSSATVVRVAANTGVTGWLETAVSDFNATEPETADGDRVYIEVVPLESGLAVAQVATNNSAMWIPDEMVWVEVLADQGNNQFNDCVSVAESPLVIGMWRDVAESLGWPGLPLGWLDIGSLAADPASWRYFSGGDYGDSLRLSHTHPGLSGTGTSTLLALVQAAQSQQTAVSTNDIQQPIVQASVGAFEGAVASFANNTASLGQTMQERGTSYLGAAVMYESTVVQFGAGNIVPIYPLEGTFMATHPACVNSGASEVERAGALLFREYLLGEEGQTTAVASGLRPVNETTPIVAPLTEENGIDLTQPEIIFNEPTVETVYAVQELWQSARKDVNLVMLLDVSGSMRGSPMRNMQSAAVQFVEQMGDDDRLTVIAFSMGQQVVVNQALVGEERANIVQTINNLQASGDTTLYDAIARGSELISDSKLSNVTNAMIVLSDGQDTSSYNAFNDTLIQGATANDTTIFTIAYGSGADADVMERLAVTGNGNYYQGTEASIAAIYEDMSAAFGGSVGVGR